MKITPNFSMEEFDSKDGTPMPFHIYPNIKRLAKNLQVLRNVIGVPLHVLSGWRSDAHNKAVGGAPQSQHPKGRAGDVKSNVYTAKYLYNKAEELIAAGKMEQGGLGLYPTFIHYDYRGKKARW